MWPLQGTYTHPDRDSIKNCCVPTIKAVLKNNARFNKQQQKSYKKTFLRQLEEHENGQAITWFTVSFVRYDDGMVIVHI